jgi:CII-binding regulator of phage lambda lysogenization HflD
VAGPAGNNLRELARIHQRIVELEKTAEQVHIITSKLKEEQSRGRRLEVQISQLQQDLQAANSESERLRGELQAWYEREEELLRREMAVGGNDKRTRSDSINGAAALLGGFKKQRVLEQDDEKEGEGGAGAPDEDEKRGSPADVGRPSHIVSL